MRSVRAIEREHGLVVVDEPGPGSVPGRPGTTRGVTARSRRYSAPRRDHGVHPRFTAGEYTELAAAAERAGLTPTGYVGEAALAVARRDR